jgi:hypothetical protein
METLLVRLKTYDPRRGFVLRRFTYAGIKFHEERGWYRVEPDVAEYLRGVRQISTDPFSPLAFDVCTDEQAKALEQTEAAEAKVRHAAADEIEVTRGRASGAVTTSDLKPPAPPRKPRQSRRAPEPEPDPDPLE